MTADQIEQTPLRITAPQEERDTTHDRVPFYLGEDDDTIYTAVRPKMAVLLDVAEAVADDSNEMAQAAAFKTLLQQVLDAASYSSIRMRLMDPKDELDLDHPLIQQMFRDLVGLWYGGPTGRPAGSSRSRGTTGRRSTVRRRSPAGTP